MYFAAIRIQLCWRSFCNKRIYKYFRELLINRLNGEPIDLLRAIAPSEAHLLDKAAGIHVRFRLGGMVYPPKIFYKIYTHRPLCDVNAFAPRNYAKEKFPSENSLLHIRSESSLSQKSQRLKKSTIRVGGSRFATLSVAKEERDWYVREENNDWRCISSQKMDQVLFPLMGGERPLFHNPPSAQPFHFSRLRRQEDVVRARKNKKREWIMKAYMFTATGKNPYLNPNIGRSKSGATGAVGEDELPIDSYEDKYGEGEERGDVGEASKLTAQRHNSRSSNATIENGERKDEDVVEREVRAGPGPVGGSVRWQLNEIAPGGKDRDRDPFDLFRTK